MALINNIYVFVQDESVSRGIKKSEHPVESGFSVTDNIRRNPVTISISGEIVGKDAAKDLRTLSNLHQQGKAVKYSGRNIMNLAIIEEFETGHPIDIYGGCSFEMKLTELMVAAPAYVAASTNKKSTKSGTQQVQTKKNEKYHIVKKGDTLWSIAKKYYGKGIELSKIYNANKKTIGNDPNKIKVGMKLLIP